MSKKKLLEESTIRSFMKLANLQPLTDKFLKESEELEEVKEDELQEAKSEEEEDEEEEGEEDEEEDDEDELKESAHVVFGHDEDAKSRGVPQDRQNPTSGAGGAHKKAPKKAKVAKPGKMDAAKHAAPDAKLKPLKQGSLNSVSSGNVKVGDETGKKSNAPKKNNSTFEVVAESVEQELEEQEMDTEAPESPEGGMEADAGSAGESPEHKEKMKSIVHSMLDLIKDMAGEYGIEMEVSGGDEAAPESPEAAPELSAPPGSEEVEEEDEMKMEQLDEMVEKLTKRVADRLVKEAKKKR
jgi:hypothetical protein